MSTVTNEQIEALGVEFKATFNRDDYKDGEGQNHWWVSFTRNGYTYQTDYHQGAGHRVWTRSINEPGQVVCKKGDPVVRPFRVSMFLADLLNKHTAPKVPTLTDVLSCLVSDAGCVEYNDFEEFCSEYGYSDDSISAKETYDACCKTRAALRKLGFRLEELQELFQDY